MATNPGKLTVRTSQTFGFQKFQFTKGSLYIALEIILQEAELCGSPIPGDLPSLSTDYPLIAPSNSEWAWAWIFRCECGIWI